MTRKDIVALPDKRLRQTSERIGVITPDIQRLATDMAAATLDWEDHRKNEVGVALAAVQIGQLLRAVVIREDFKDKDNRNFKVFINPQIVKKEGKILTYPEGCLSVKDVYGLVPRYEKIKVKALNLQGKSVRVTATGFLARVFQHEIDHTKGTLFIDHIKSGEFFLLNEKGELVPLSAEEVKKRKLIEYQKIS